MSSYTARFRGVSIRYNMSGQSVYELQHEPQSSDCKADTDRTRILYVTYQMHTCI